MLVHRPTSRTLVASSTTGCLLQGTNEVKAEFLLVSDEAHSKLECLSPLTTHTHTHVRGAD